MQVVGLYMPQPYFPKAIFSGLRRVTRLQIRKSLEVRTRRDLQDHQVQFTYFTKVKCLVQGLTAD